MPAQVTVLYPNEPDATFDMKYYLDSHLPLVQKHWGSEGLTGWKVLKFGADASSSVQATLDFVSLEAFQKAAGGPHTAEIMGDVQNFSNKSPNLMAAEIVGTS